MLSKVFFSLCPSIRKAERESSVLKNGSMLLEDLIASCDGESNPICTYSADELVKATDNFHPSCLISEDSDFQVFRGFLDDRSVLIKKYFQERWLSEANATSMAIRDIIISMQMSTHKNALKLLGCCLEFSIPALVLEYAAKGVLDNHGGLGFSRSLPWKTRMLIANKVANALAYLHTAFPRPIIHRGLNPACIFLDDDYLPKLSDFSLSITIPPQQLHVEDDVKGTYRYLDPTYMATGYLTEKTDVYSFGVVLLVFLMGRKIQDVDQAAESVPEYVKLHASNGEYKTIVDPCILEEVGADEQAHQQLQDFLALALLCTKDEREERPCMIDVAKELVRIEKSILCY
ncbi:inactive serine/threonine-protein kinase [Pyrus ussuriensis x Pyrus communis]|uniref:Inactive serine/threonine-protein kinase n=1 Tax=Pyrus ussuriensis x Pyrus communis TaxID=2448454 RepID=A0A5N5G0T9_9ROSA|nr:inactive serine/threonine-protein kinase [Pyrus ussuriensis x Pyrus communis]